MDLQINDFTAFKNERPLTMTIGNFDGLHLGHQALIQKTHFPDTESAVLTFSPHPMKVLRGMKDHVILMSQEKKISLIQSMGIEHLFIANFDLQMASTTKEAFINQLKALQVKRLVLGVDFRFASHASGHVEDLKQHFEVIILDNVTHQDTRISKLISKTYCTVGN